MTYPDAAAELACQLWRKGHSATAIADHIGRKRGEPDWTSMDVHRAISQHLRRLERERGILA